MRRLIVLIAFGWLTGVNAQNFQKIYLFEDTFAIISDIHVTDSGYYFCAASGRGYQRSDAVVGRLNLDGTVGFYAKDITPNEYNRVGGGLTQLDTNYNGNFFLSYRNEVLLPEYSSQPNFTEVDVNGNILFSHTFDFLTNDSLSFPDYGQSIQSTFDSTYIGFFSYNDLTQHHPDFGDLEGGVLLFKYNSNGDTLWTKRFRYPGVNVVKPVWTVGFISQEEDNSISFTVNEIKTDHLGGVMSTGKIHFFRTDANGNELSHHVFQDGQYIYGGYTILQIADGSRILPYYDSRVVETTTNHYEREYRALLARLSTNYQVVWKDTLDRKYYQGFGLYEIPYHMHLLNDSVFAGAYAQPHDTLYDPEDWTTARSFLTVRLFNKTINGNTLWTRDYQYWDESDSLGSSEYTITDFELTPDGGYIMCGHTTHYDSLVANVPGQFGYVLKTNCLGFLGEPQSAFSYQATDSFQVQFSNQSVQAGSYLWDFGDGEQLSTGETSSTVTHTYAHAGTFEVNLIAFGCEGNNDTLKVLITVPEIPTDTVSFAGDGTLLTLFPNPLIAGESLSFYVGNVPENATFQLMDYNGKIITTIGSLNANTTYILPIDCASGMYLASILDGSEVLETERLMVE